MATERVPRAIFTSIELHGEAMVADEVTIEVS